MKPQELKHQVAHALVVIGTVGATMVLGANVYQEVVEVPNWSHDVPRTIADFRACVRTSHPGFFFQVLVPLTMLSLVGASVGSRGRPRHQTRWVLGALAGVVAAEIFTVAYFFPRNEILFFGDLSAHAPDVIAQAATEWARAHLLRMAMLLTGVACAMRALLLSARDA